MTHLIHKQGDLFTSTTGAIGHGVNTEGVMGHGIAVEFRKRWPDMYTKYKELCENGTLEPGGLMVWEPEDGGDFHTIFNLASQDLPGKHARLDWLYWSVTRALWVCDQRGIPALALPRIGAGIGGLNWEDVESILIQAAESYKTDIEIWTQ